MAAQSYREWCDRAADAIEADSLDLAEEYIRQALQADPANPHNALLFSNLGTIQRRQHRYELALESYTYALNIVPRAVPVLLNRAAVYLELGRNDAARVDYSLALDMEKDNEEALQMRAYIYMQMRDYKSARADYERLLRLDPHHYNGMLGLATLAQKERKPGEALELLDRMIDEGQSGLEAARRAVLYVARAGVEYDMGQADAALVDLAEALGLDAGQAEAYLLRGRIYLEQNKKVLAKRDFEQAVLLGIPQSEMKEWLRLCR